MSWAAKPFLGEAASVISTIAVYDGASTALGDGPINTGK